jgi:hypothetical protein
MLAASGSERCSPTTRLIELQSLPFDWRAFEQGRYRPKTAAVCAGILNELEARDTAIARARQALTIALTIQGVFRRIEAEPGSQKR